MDKSKIIIEGEFPALNEIIALSKSHFGAYSKAKKQHTEDVISNCWGEPSFEKVDALYFTWFCKNKRKDPDNIAAGIKFVLDGLVEAGVLPGDGWRYLGDCQIIHDWAVDKDRPRVEVTIKGRKTK